MKKYLCAALGIFGILAAGLRIYNTASLPPRYAPTSVFDTVFTPETSFSDYIEYHTTMLKTIHPRRPDSVRANIAPFELKPEKETNRGVLLIHGLTDTPFAMKDIAKEAVRRGYHVRALLLPGHGTVPGDLRTIHRRRWEKALAYGIASFEDEVDTLYGIGYSLGGALLFAHAREDDFAGLGLISPAITLPPEAVLPMILQYSMPWYRKEGDTNPYKYESVCMSSMAQTYHVSRKAQKRYRRGDFPDIPLFIAASGDDATLGKIDLYREIITDRDSDAARGLFYVRGETPDSGQIIYRRAQYPEENIFSFSHLSLPYAPDNPRYGRDQNFRFCFHYPPNSSERTACLRTEDIPLGEAGIQDTAVFARLFYNPDFYSMTRFLFDFFEEL
jgi:esterase/lipase